MTGTAFTRRSKALTIVPLALLSGLWSVSLVTTSAGASGEQDTDLPDGSSVPTEAIEAPASVPQPGLIAPGVPAGSSDEVVASASTGGIPSAAIAAYQRGAQIINAADKTCNIPWELVAAIGRVESNHGRFGGNVLNEDGVATPGIYGIALDGKNNTQAISDTDGGALDNDTVFDRAVGPMQFIPSTWAVVKVDADGDGQRNPQDIDDAALATAVYLCSGNENLSVRSGQEAAVYRYNHSKDYVNLVLRLMEAYQVGDYTAVPSGSYGGTTFTPDYGAAISDRRAKALTGRNNTKSGSNTTKPGTKDNSAPATDGDKPATDDGQKGPVDVISPSSNPIVDNPIVKPVVDVLTTVEATVLCNEQLGQIPLVGGLIRQATPICAAQVQGKTEEQALGIIPTTLDGVRKLLGL